MKKLVVRGVISVFILFLSVAFTILQADANRRAVLEGVQFEPGTSQLKPGADGELQSLLSEMQKDSDLSVEIQGHVVPGQSVAADRELSSQRAQRIKDWLVEHGIAARRITVIGYGSLRPMVENSSESGRRINERIEIVKSHSKYPVAEMTEREFQFASVPDGKSILHEFRVQNTGDAILEITEVKTG
jgi:hypothetical protein